MEAENQTTKQGMHRLSSLGRKCFDLIEFDPDEQLLLEIRKHPIGLFFIYVTGIFIAFSLISVITGLVVSGFIESIGFGGYESVAVFIGFLLSVGIGVVTYINGFLYTHNVIFVTNEKIAQVVYITIFSRKVSQLGIGDAQDVTVEQKSFLARAYNYGTLTIETAGEQNNYVFNYVPNPYKASKVIISSHEDNLKHYGN